MENELDIRNQSFIPPKVSEYQQSCGLVNPMLIAEQLKHKLHWGQEELATHFLAENRDKWDIYIALCSRRWGKSYVMDDIAIAELLTPNANVGIVTFGLKRAKEHFKTILRALQSIPALKGKVTGLKQEQTIEIDGFNSTLIISSETTYDARIVGTELTLLLLDEFFLINPIIQQDLLDAIIPTMATYGTYKDSLVKYGKIAIFSTPRLGKLQSPAGQIFAKAESNLPEFASYKYSKYDVYSNPLVSKEIVESDRQKMSESKFKREYLLEFENGGTKVLRNFYENKHCVNINDLEELLGRDDLYLVVSADFGQTDGNAMLFTIYDDRSDIYYVMDGTYAKNRLTRDMYAEGVKIIDNLKSKYNISEQNIVYMGDPSSPENIKIAWVDYGMNMFGAKNDRIAGFDKVNERLEGTAKVSTSIYVNEDLKEVIRQWDFAQFKQVNGLVSSNYDRDILDTHYEYCDLIRYTVYTFDKYNQKSSIIIG